jgi:hypothetical protein
MEGMIWLDGMPLGTGRSVSPEAPESHSEPHQNQQERQRPVADLVDLIGHQQPKGQQGANDDSGHVI